MTNKLVVITNSLKVPKIKKILVYEMKFLVPNYSCLQKPWLGGYRYRPQISVLSVLCPQLHLNPPEQNSWVRHWLIPCIIPLMYSGGRWTSWWSVYTSGHFNQSRCRRFEDQKYLLPSTRIEPRSIGLPSRNLIITRTEPSWLTDALWT